MDSKDTKEHLIKTIKEWVKLDTEIKTIQQEVNKRKKEQKNISSELITIMKKHEVDCFDITGGQIIYSRKNIKKPITKKLLLDILAKYYEGDQEKAEKLNTFILDNREETIKESIHHKPIH
jgi:hypothetical protein